jgi:hypothetical protein
LVSVEVIVGIIDDLEQQLPLSRQADAALAKR